MFEFAVKYWDGEKNAIAECRGMLAASSYGDAAQKAAEYCSVPGTKCRGIASVFVCELEDPICYEEIADWINGGNS